MVDNTRSSLQNTEDIQQYLDEINRIPRLSPEEERELARKCTEGDEDAIRLMVKSNLRLVVHISKGYAGRGVPLLDLIQEGSIGLLIAARKFDYAFDCRFSTYATKWIRHCITRCLMNSSSTIRVPLHTAEKVYKVSAVKSQLQNQLGTEPTAEEIAKAAGISAEKADELLHTVPDICSLDLPADSTSLSLAELTEDRTALQPHAALVRHELELAIESMFQSLNERQQRILRLHFGMEDGSLYSLDEISKLLGISKERVRQIERQALTKLQQLGTSIGLEDFLE